MICKLFIPLILGINTISLYNVSACDVYEDCELCATSKHYRENSHNVRPKAPEKNRIRTLPKAPSIDLICYFINLARTTFSLKMQDPQG